MPRDANREPLHAARERIVVGFDDEMDVVVLNREVDDAKDVAEPARCVGRANAPDDLAGEDRLAQRRKTFAYPHRDVNRVSAPMPLARPVAHLRPNPTRPPGAFTNAAVLTEFEVELLHLKRAYITQFA